MKRFAVITTIIAAMAMLLLAGCSAQGGNGASADNSGSSAQSASHIVTDMKGNTVEVPDEVGSYVCLWKSYTSVLAYLDGCERLYGCDYDNASERDAWLFEICPAANKLVVMTEETTAEEIAESGVDVVFWQSSANDELAQKLNDMGIPAVNVNFSDYDELQDSVKLAAEVLGDDAAKEKAADYCAYLQDTMQSVSSKIDTLSDDELVSVLNLRSFETLRADGGGTVADTWITLAGGKNVVAENGLEGNQNLNAEQIIEWNPDVIVSSVYGDDDQIMASSTYAELDAVKNGNVYTNPAALFYWNRYSIETPLQLLWAAKTLHPEMFTDVDVVKEVQGFYSKYFGYELSDEDAERMLKALPPSGYEK